VSLQQVYAEAHKDILFATCWCVYAVVSCFIWWNLRQWLNINKFS